VLSHCTSSGGCILFALFCTRFGPYHLSLPLSPRPVPHLSGKVFWFFFHVRRPAPLPLAFILPGPFFSSFGHPTTNRLYRRTHHWSVLSAQCLGQCTKFSLAFVLARHPGEVCPPCTLVLSAPSTFYTVPGFLCYIADPFFSCLLRLLLYS